MNFIVTYHHMARTPLKLRKINEFGGNISPHGSNTTKKLGKLMNLMVTYHHMARTPLKLRKINEFDGNIPSHGSNTLNT